MMRFTLERVTQPEIEVITLAEAKLHLRSYSDQTEEDDYISELIKVAREWVENYTGRVLVDSTWRLNIENEYTPFPYTDSNLITGIYIPRADYGITLHRSPVLSITSFSTIDSAGAATVIDSSTYEVRYADSKWPRVYPLSGPSWNTGQYRIEFRAGFADRVASPKQESDVVPAVLKHAVKLIVANYYQLREPVNVGNITTELPLTIKWLLNSERCNLEMA